jgi:AraC-like DNA-binding protein
MEPDLEVIQIRPGECFTVFSHGYPFRTVRWHFHPEYELHLIVETSGQYFVGDFIGRFQPGNLVLTGPNLPHNWVSEVPEGTSVPRRCQLIQFNEAFLADAMHIMPELAGIEPVLKLSQRGAQFDDQTSAAIQPIMDEVMHAQGVRRIELFMMMMGHLSRARDVRALASTGYLPDPSGYMSAGINKALAHIRAHLIEAFTEADLARIAGQTTPAFSRAFRRHTGMSLVQYVKRLRINLACQLLMTEEAMSITDICFQAGFNNLSNFNRQFLTEKGMTPSLFRKLLLDNAKAANAA